MQPPASPIPEEDAPLLPVRGLVPLHTRRGVYRAAADVARWVRLSRVAYKCAKIDFLDAGFDPARTAAAAAIAREHDVLPALRTACRDAPAGFGGLAGGLLAGLLIAPETLRGAHLRDWLEAAAGLPLRVQLPPGRALLDLDDACIAALAAAKPAVVQLDLGDSFVPAAPCRSAAESAAAMARLEAALEAAAACGAEIDLIGVPPGAVAAGFRGDCLDAWQVARDHQHYNAASVALAEALYARRPNLAAAAVLCLLARNVSRLSQIDNFVLARTLHVHEGILSMLTGLHRLTRLGGLPRGVPRPIDARLGAPGDALPPPRNAAARASGAFARCFPGAAVAPDASPLPRARARYYDAADAARRDWPEACRALAREAQRIVTGRRFDREIAPSEYGSENAHTLASPGANRWCSVANVEKRSTRLGDFAPPFTLQTTVGGGHAEYAGFAFGAHARVLCPLEAFGHTLTLHVAGDGHYVLLRDGRLVRPVEFNGPCFVPRRLASRLDPRLCLWNIDGEIFTQSVLVWEGGETAPAAAAPRYSVVIVCTRYARRLQAVLLSIARQRGIDLAALEIIVAYVPGIDAVDDTLDSLGAAFPALRIVRAPYGEQDAQQKGRMINETVRLSRAEWIVLLDADTVLLPDTFARIGAAAAPGVHFIAPDGRKMLDPDTTAKVLLGLVAPDAALLDGPGEWRRREADGVPIGFCQAVRRACFDTVQYEEHGHFEGADWRFAQAIREHFGPEVWLDGLPALHLDHGASNWYGAQRHY